MTRERQYQTLAALAVVHAVLVLVLWLSAIQADVVAVSGRVWLFLTWLWLAWLPVLFLHPGRTRLRFIVPATLSLVALVPCIPTAYTFTVWAVGGFAP
jgi:hypothetical protein